MAQDREKLIAYKNQCKKYEIDLEQLRNEMEYYKVNEDKADAKITALNKIHSEKTKNLMNSITLLKKENRSLEKQASGGAQSKLIAQLNKDIQEQEIVINTLRDILGRENISDEKADEDIIKALNKGPPKIKAPSREEMKIEIKRLQSQKGVGGGGNKSMNQSRLSGKNDKLDQSNISVAKSKISDMNESVVSEDKADSIENLIRRLEDFKQENDELKLNLKAEQEILEKFEDELENKTAEINDLRAAKTDYIVLAKKYETLQKDIADKRKEENDKYIGNYDKGLKVDELENLNKQQQNKLKNLDEILELERENASSRIEELEKRNREMETKVSTTQSNYDKTLRSNTKLQTELSSAKTLLLELKKDKNNSESQNKMKIESLEEKKFNLEKQLAKKDQEYNLLQQQLTAIKVRLESTEQELYDVKQKGEQLAAIGDIGIITGMNAAQNGGDGNNNELRQKVKQLTKKEIELQDQIEALQQEVHFREQREKVINYVNKKQIGSSIQEQELKRKYQKEIQQRYETKTRKLILRVKELESKNQELQEIHQMLESQADLIASEMSSEVSISLTALENIQVESNASDIQDLQQSQEVIVQKDSKQLKNKLRELTGREIELQNQIQQLQKENQYFKSHEPQNSVPNEEFDKKMRKMQNEYDKIIGQLSNKVADLEMQDVRLSKISSNIGSDILSQKNYNANDIKDIDSNISFSVNDIKRKEVSISKVSSNIDSLLQSENEDQNQQYNNQHNFTDSNIGGGPSIKINNTELDNISSGISDISGMSQKKY